MAKRSHTVSSPATAVVCLPKNGCVWAIIVGVETYQSRHTGALPSVEHARNDATGFADILRNIYPSDKLDIVSLVDNDATIGNIDNELKRAISGLGKEDLFVFYYAGHGFHGAGGNRITAWDTHAHNVEGTTLLLRDVLLDRLEGSDCTRSLAFIDACAIAFDNALVPGRNVISALDTTELAAFLKPERYSGIFLSCEPGQASYPADRYHHGVWTYFLLRALRGEAEEALDRDRYITDTSLRDYLRQEVPRFITHETTFKGNQKPQAIISASNTFAIRHVPERVSLSAPEGDLSSIRIAPRREFFERIDSNPIKSLTGFNKRLGHFVPDRVSKQTTDFVRGLVADKIDEEIQDLYANVKSAFRLKRRDISQVSGHGQGSLDIMAFRFSIDVRQNRSDSSEYVILRRLELREGATVYQEQIDSVFGAMFNRIVVEGRGMSLDFDALVDFFEDIVSAHGGALEEEQHRDRVTYTASDGMQLVFDVGRQRISLGGGGRQQCSTLLEQAHRYRFGLSGPSQLLLAYE